MNLNIMLSHVILNLRRQDFRGQVSDFFSYFAQNKSTLIIPDYKTHQQIMSLVLKCGKMLASTLEKYNKLVTTMSPPKPRLSWDQITNLDFILDVVLLQGCDDVHQKSWANP